MKIKICGLTCLDDVLLASDLGADYLGFIFYEKSLRCNSLPQAARMISKYNGPASPVAVFVDSPVESILHITQETGIRIVQLHGNETQEMIEELRKHHLHVFKSLPVRNEDSFSLLQSYNPDRFLLDTWHPYLKGGTGHPFDWNLLKQKEKDTSQCLVAGGISPDNIHSLLKIFIPWGLDVSSGIEVSPGKKDPVKMKQLFTAIGIHTPC